LGLKFRRQQVVAGFIVDFYCAEHRLALELDGPVHDARGTRDAGRTAALFELGIRTVRLPNDQLSKRRLIEILSTTLDALPPLPAEHPSGRRRP
jgi:very-short-patch-repair endonuclease